MILPYILIFIISFLSSKIIAYSCNSILINKYHIHHWMWALVIIFIPIIYRNLWFTILILGILIEGLTYKDRFLI